MAAGVLAVDSGSAAIAADFLVLLGLSITGRVPMGRMMGAFWGVISSLSGTKVHVGAQGNNVSIRIL